MAVVTSFRIFGSALASSSRSSREEYFELDEVIRRVLEDENDNEGMPNDEESDLDNQLYDPDNNLR